MPPHNALAKIGIDLMMFKRIMRNLGLISALLWAMPAAAEALRNGDVLGDWKYSCVAISEGQTNCAFTQTILLEPDTPPLARITFQRDVEPEQVVVSLLVPLGSELSFSPMLAAGDQGLAVPYIVCMSDGCVAQALVSVESIASFLISDQLAVIYKRYGEDGMVRIPASSNGLTDAFKSLGLF